MGVSYFLIFSGFSTALSFICLQLWTEISLDKFQTDGLISEKFIHTENVNRVLELLLGSYTTVALLVNFLLNVFILFILTLKTVFFGQLYPSETRKLIECLVNYVIYKSAIRFGLLDGWNHLVKIELLAVVYYFWSGSPFGFLRQYSGQGLDGRYIWTNEDMQGFQNGNLISRIISLRERKNRMTEEEDQFKLRWLIINMFACRNLLALLDIFQEGTFLPLVIPPTVLQAGLWFFWLTVICCLKMFQALGRDRLERLNASPSATPWAYFRVFSVFLFVLSFNIFWIWPSFVLYKTLNSSMFLLLFFEPLSIAFETMQAILVHGFQLLEISFHPVSNDTGCQRAKLFDLSAGGSFWEWKGILIRNLGFFLDLATLIMAVGHYVLIWWLHGMAFHLVDAILFLNIRALLTAIVKRVKGFIKLRMALGTLHAALPDATSDEIRAYDDECAICREPMAKAKKLHCNHLFHLACLRSWLDQGLNDVYSCPTCRKPLFLGGAENEVNAPQIDSGVDRQNIPSHTFPNQMQNSVDSSPWRSAGLDPGWSHSWPNQGVDGAGPSTGIGSVGFGRVHMMMRHLASVGETALEDTAWNLWSMNPSQAAASTSSVPPNVGGRYPGNAAGSLHIRTASSTENGNIANILAMGETVREVLPHVSDEMIFQDLQRTNSVAETVNNLLLQM